MNSIDKQLTLEEYKDCKKIIDQRFTALNRFRDTEVYS